MIVNARYLLTFKCQNFFGEPPKLAAPVAERLRALFLNHPTISPAVSGVGSSPTLATRETSQVMLAGVPGGFSRGSPVFAHLLIGPSHMS